MNSDIAVEEVGRAGMGFAGPTMGRLVELVDAAYLETDKPQNVGFYEKFGFKLIGEATVPGTPSWFMGRGAR